MSQREQQLKRIIRDMLRPLKDIPLDIIIEAITEGKCTIWPYDGHAQDKLEKIALYTLQYINAHGIRSRRPNEVGNYCEPYVKQAIEAVQGKAEVPAAFSGRRKAAGYPDLVAQLEGKPFYIEVKSYNERNRETTQRSFYLSPSSDFKVTKDAYHLILALCMEEVTQEGQHRIYKARSCTIIDAHDLPCDVKYEFNSDNQRLYGNPERIIINIQA